LGNQKGRYHAEDLGVDGRMLLEWFLGRKSENMDWVHLAQDRDQWDALVNTVMNHRVP
jgi:hypothetical protein